MGAKLASPSGSGKRSRAEVNAEPNVIPFVDVMLVLLIIFMVAAPIASVDINVDLPAAKVIPSKRPAKPVYVSLQDFGAAGTRVFVGNEEVSLDDLGRKAQEEVVRNNPRRQMELADIIQERIYIRAQRETAYRNVVLVMNRLQDQGFFKVALVAEDRRR